MFRKLWSTLDRLVASINGLAERFELADAELAARIEAGRPQPVELPPAGDVVEGAPPTDATAEPAAKGRKSKAA